MFENKAAIIVLGVLSVCLTITITVLVYYTYSTLAYSSFQFIQELGENWNAGPILDLSLGNNCAYNLLNDKWQGTVTGCNCALYKFPSRGACSRSSKSSQRYCPDVLGIPARPLSVWDGGNICRTQTSDNYLELTVTTDNCPLILPKKCSIIDTFGNFLCIPAGLDCPINDIQIINFSTPTPFGYSEIILATSKLVYTKTKLNGITSVQTKIDESTPCLNPAETNIRAAYSLEKYYPNDFCTSHVDYRFFDNNYIYIRNTNYMKLLNENNILPLVSILPKYPISSLDKNVNLYIRSYVGISFQCKANILSKYKSKEFVLKLINLGNNIEPLVSLSSSNFIVVIIAIFILSFGIPVGRVNDIAAIICFVIYICFIIAVMGMSGAIPSQISALGQDHYILKGCFDQDTNHIFQKFIFSIDISSTYAIVSAILCGVEIVLFVVLILAGIYCKDRSCGDNNNSDHNIGYSEDIHVGVGVGVGNVELNIHPDTEGVYRHYDNNTPQANLNVQLNNQENLIESFEDSMEPKTENKEHIDIDIKKTPTEMEFGLPPTLMEQTSQITKNANYGIGFEMNLPPIHSDINNNNVVAEIPNKEINPVILGGFNIYNEEKVSNPEQNFYNNVNKITKGEQLGLKINFSDLNNGNASYGLSDNVNYGLSGNVNYGASGNIGASDNYGIKIDNELSANTNYGLSGNAGYGFSGNADFGVNANADIGVGASYGVNSNFGFDANYNTNSGTGANYGLNADYGVNTNLNANNDIGTGASYGANVENNQGFGANINVDNITNTLDDVRFQGHLNLNANVNLGDQK